MTTIWKYKLNITDRQVIMMPVGAKILAVQVQHGEPCLWARIHPNREEKKRLIKIYGTGNNELMDEDRYIGTFQMADGDFIWHVFEAAT